MAPVVGSGEMPARTAFVANFMIDSLLDGMLKRGPNER
jgi:hypothetical protein